MRVYREINPRLSPHWSMMLRLIIKIALGVSLESLERQKALPLRGPGSPSASPPSSLRVVQQRRLQRTAPQTRCRHLSLRSGNMLDKQICSHQGLYGAAERTSSRAHAGGMLTGDVVEEVMGRERLAGIRRRSAGILGARQKCGCFDWLSDVGIACLGHI